MERNTEADLPPLLLLHLLLVQQNTDKWITGCPTGNGGMQKRKLARNAHTLRIHVSARFGADLHARSVAYRQKLLRPELRRKFVRSARCRLGEWINLPGPHACPPSTVSCLHNGVGLTPPLPLLGNGASLWEGDRKKKCQNTFFLQWLFYTSLVVELSFSFSSSSSSSSSPSSYHYYYYSGLHECVWRRVVSIYAEFTVLMYRTCGKVDRRIRTGLKWDCLSPLAGKSGWTLLELLLFKF